ncbi:hypothetical protein FACS189430_11120 [Bacteroidia bacterium]|nr:hypothetical protein FACS189430_11120 [Bacteroidia bacterium]
MAIYSNNYVTLSEYDKAKEVVERYEAQILKLYNSDYKDYERLIYLLSRDVTSMSKNERLVSTRLLNILRTSGPFSIEDLSEVKFRSMRNAGIGTWEQFCKYRRIVSETDDDALRLTAFPKELLREAL